MSRQLPRRLMNEPRVFDTRVPDKFGVVSDRGPEVSQITWEDGSIENVTNKYIKLKD